MLLFSLFGHARTGVLTIRLFFKKLETLNFNMAPCFWIRLIRPQSSYKIKEQIKSFTSKHNNESTNRNKPWSAQLADGVKGFQQASQRQSRDKLLEALTFARVNL
uniref:Uncharacterized protein n=1 Tax=Cacopsylla melanoneura TaxID=428564 RepID=A0A8D8QCD5_9HEMI